MGEISVSHSNSYLISLQSTQMQILATRLYLVEGYFMPVNDKIRTFYNWKLKDELL